MNRKKPAQGTQNAIDWRKDTHALKKYQFAYHFLPHPDEKRRATLLSNKAFFLYCLAIVFVGFTIRIIPLFFPGVLGYASNINSKDLQSYTNKKRASFGLSSLSMNSELSAAAKKKAEDMFKDNYWAHVAPDGKEPWDFILAAGYDYVYAGENLAKNFSNSKDVVEAWYNSPSHRENLLNKNYTEMGFAVVNGTLNGYQTTLVVQMFGKPRTPVQVAAVPSTKSTTTKPAETPAPAPTPSVNTQPKETTEEKPTPVISETPAPNVEEKKEPVPEFPEFQPLPNSNIKPSSTIVYQEIRVSPKVDLTTASRILTVMFGGFVMFLLVLDYWYTRKLGIIKINGQTIAHISFMFILILSVWFVLRPGAII